MKTTAASIAVIFVAAAVGSCTVHPHGELRERAVALEAGHAYEPPAEERRLPALSPDATPEEMVRYALLTNAQVEARYWEWRSALEQVPQEGTQKTNLMISLDAMIINGTNAAHLDTLTFGNDPMNNIVLPSKLRTAAAEALEKARAAGMRFDQARFELRGKLLAAYFDYALTAELARLEEENNQLLDLAAQMVKLRIGTGTALQQDLLRSGNALDASKNEIAALHAREQAAQVAINALLNRDPAAQIALPKVLPEPREIADDDAEIVRRAAQGNPELKALAAEIAGKREGITRARQEYLPEFGVSASTDLAGSVQSLFGSVALPILRYEAIDAGVRQAEDNLRASDAMRRQFRNELAARVVSDLITLRDAERQVEFIEKNLIPRTRQAVSAAQVSYGANQSTMLDLLDGARSLIALRRLAAEMKMTREKQVADLEAAIGGELTPATTKTSATQPALDHGIP